MINDISKKEKKKGASTCPFSAGGSMPGMEGFGGLGGLAAMKMLSAFGGMGSMNSENLAFNPEKLAKMVYNLLNNLRVRVIEALHNTRTGVSYPIKPVLIFTLKNPYQNNEDMLSEKEGFEALDQMKDLKDKLKSKYSNLS